MSTGEIREHPCAICGRTVRWAHSWCISCQVRERREPVRRAEIDERPLTDAWHRFMADRIDRRVSARIAAAEHAAQEWAAVAWEEDWAAERAKGRG